MTAQKDELLQNVTKEKEELLQSVTAELEDALENVTAELDEERVRRAEARQAYLNQESVVASLESKLKLAAQTQNQTQEKHAIMQSVSQERYALLESVAREREERLR